MTGLGRSIGDLMLAVSALQDSGLTGEDRLAVFGHSLGGKLAMHLAALDPRLDAGAAHEPGLGFAHSNWTDPWYLDGALPEGDRKSTRLNSSHVAISYAVFCLKKKTQCRTH